MKCIVVPEAGGPEVMAVGESDRPQPAAREVLIRVAYAGVNRPDVFQRMGLYPPPPDASPLLGLEVSGEIVAVGSEVTAWAVGDEVCALVNGGGYAEFAVAPEQQCLPVPRGLSLAQAAALPETCFTVWSNVFQRGRLQAGESLLVHAGASGIGTTAIQMATAMGARVFATVGSEEKAELCRSLGAEVAINYNSQDFVEVVNAQTQSRGVDVILDCVGGDYMQRNMAIAALDGRIVNIAYLRGSVAETNFLPVMLKRLTLTGSTLRPQSLDAKTGIAAGLRQFIWPLIAEGKMAPVMAAEYPLAEVGKAHQLMESNQLIGKIVLKI